MAYAELKRKQAEVYMYILFISIRLTGVAYSQGEASIGCFTYYVYSQPNIIVQWQTNNKTEPNIYLITIKVKKPIF